MTFAPREVIEKHLEKGAGAGSSLTSAKPTLTTNVSEPPTDTVALSTTNLPGEPKMPTMTITRPTMDTDIGTTRPTMGTSWLQKSQTRTEVRMTQEEYRRQEVRQTLDKVSKVEKVEKMERVETNTAGQTSREAEAFAEERGSWTMTVTDHLLGSSESKDSRLDGENHLVEEEAAKRREAESGEMRKREEEKRSQLQQDLEVRRRAQFEEERRLKEEEEVRKAKEEETRRAIEEEEIRLKREDLEKNLMREREVSLKREELANQTLLQTSTPNKEEKHLVVSRQEISEEERQEMLRERQEFLRIPKQEMVEEEEEEGELGRTRKYFITQQEIVFYVKVAMIGMLAIIMKM